MSRTTDDALEPYLSVVVTTRNDDHGGDPLKRLQALVNTFDAQCALTGLNAELIVVEWNPAADKPRVSSVLRIPDPPHCTVRFIEVAPELHQRLRYSDVLPLFQMIAKNVGIRRARGEFVLATNIDIILSTELVEYMAERRLQPGTLYRVDRHDIQSAFPIDAPLAAQMEYCATHHLRLHTRWGSYPVDPRGAKVGVAEDIVDGTTVRLGAGWHIKEGGGQWPTYRWAAECAELIVDAGSAADGELVVEVESNPYDPGSWCDVAVMESKTVLVSTKIAGSMTVAIPLRGAVAAGPRVIELRVTASPADARHRLPAFERRNQMSYCVRRAQLRSATPVDAGLTVSRSQNGMRQVARAWVKAAADAIGARLATMLGARLRYRVMRAAPEYRAIESQLRATEQQLRDIAPLGPLSGFHAFLLERRPPNLHVNSSGDFQLMARRDWHQLRGYAELETFSMNIDGMLSDVADAAGIREEILQMPIYHLEHEVGSGWSPEGEALLRKRIAERGIPWVDASTVYIWAAYMRWLGRPVIFNGADWGLAGAELVERQISRALVRP